MGGGRLGPALPNSRGSWWCLVIPQLPTLACAAAGPASPLCSAQYAPELSSEEVKAGREILDANNDKLISLSEFVDWWVKKAA